MSRPLRFEFAGAFYHITSRGDQHEACFEDEEDREAFLRVLGEVVQRYHWICHAFCLMTNHHHLLVETVEGNLSQGMRHLNGVYTEATNRRHRRSGHLFQRRFKGILVDKDSYLLELSRYLVLNPVRAGMMDLPEQWPWSNYGAMMGEVPNPRWLAVDALLRQFDSDRRKARKAYRRFVLEGVGRGVWKGLRQQIDLGDEAFIARMHARAKVHGDALSVPSAQRRAPAPALAEIAARHPERNAAMVAAYATGAHRYREIAEHFRVHLATVGRVVRRSMQPREN